MRHLGLLTASVPRDWSRAEVEATVADYFAMLTKELAREPYNKAAHNRDLRRLLDDRPPGAIEFKHANISAVLIELGYPYIDGYKPRSNYQDLLRSAVVERLESDQVLRAAAAAAVAAPAGAAPEPADWATVFVDPPRPDADRSRGYERRVPPARPLRGINYLEREARNASLGAAGEEFVLRVEHARLWQQGSRRLADRIEHVARTRGDGPGFDILSFEPDGRERMIEVKTTRFGAMTPFFATRNEVEVSESASHRYHVYRVFKFEASPRLFILPGSLRQSVVLDPMLYRASLP